MVCRLRLVCHPEKAGLCGGFSLCKVTFISRISHYVKERIVVIMFRRRRIVAACSPVVSVCTRWCRIVAVPAMCVWGRMPHLLCAFPGWGCLPLRG